MKKTGIITFALLLLAIPLKGLAEVPDSVTVERLLAGGDTTTLHYARQLLGRPYVAHTLEVNDKEQLVVNLRELDCTTLVETVCALTLTAREKKHDYRSFCRHLRQLRYRQGRLNGYPSRLHYFSDWIDDNTTMGLVHEIGTGVDMGKKSQPFTAIQALKLNYMSTHPQAYKALRQHPDLLKQIAAQEKRLTGRKCPYIPKATFYTHSEKSAAARNSEGVGEAALRQVIRDGDILAITCSKPGLDIAHLGFAVWRKDGLHLLNASQLHKKVVEETMTLGEYLAKHPTHTGIRVIRL